MKRGLIIAAGTVLAAAGLAAGAAGGPVSASGTPDFALSTPAGGVTTAQRAKAATVVTTAVSGGFSAAVTLSATSLPAGVTAAFSPATIPAPGAGTATVTLTTTSTTPAGSYTVSLVGTSGALVHSVPLPLTVTPYTTTTVTIYSDTFEGSFPGSWQTFRLGANAGWGASSYRSYSGAHSAYCAASGSAAAPNGGPYPANENSWMIYGPFSLADATAAQATFQYWLSTQASHDYFEYMVSTVAFNTGYQGFKKSGSPVGWQSGTLNFDDQLLSSSALGHSQVWLALIFASDASTQGEGAYVDALSITKTVSAATCLVTCTATAPAFGAPGTPVQLAGTINAASCTGSPAFNWSFADGTPSSTAPSPAHAWANAGSYTWQMTASMGGQSCQRSGGVTISACTIGCDASVPATATSGQTVQLTSQVTPTSCTSAPTIAWDFGDGTPGSAAANPTHAWASPGAYPWSMTATADGRSCEKTGTVTVAAPAVCTLSCDAVVPAAGALGVPVSFHASATATDCATAPAFAWDFGDGGHAAAADATHVYAAQGAPGWSLTVTADSETCTRSGTLAIGRAVHHHLGH
jgi:PKD repeat protein